MAYTSFNRDFLALANKQQYLTVDDAIFFPVLEWRFFNDDISLCLCYMAEST